MLNHHTHQTSDISNTGKKSYAFDTGMASLSRQHNFTVRVFHRCIVNVSEFWALPPETEMKSTPGISEFRRSLHKQEKIAFIIAHKEII